MISTANLRRRPRADRSLCEDCLQLDISHPAIRRALISGRNNAGVVHWSQLGSDFAAAAFVWSAAGKVLTMRSTINGVPTEQRIKLVATTPHFAGRRWWFVCPLSGRRARIIYLAPGGRVWASRLALDLAYVSQRCRVRWPLRCRR